MFFEIVAATTFEPRPAPPLADVIVDIFPSNPVKAMADGKMLQIIVFALLFGFSLWLLHRGIGIRQ